MSKLRSSTWLLSLFFVLAFYSAHSVAESSGFACPMKCEGEKTYSAAGQCPVCHMDLEPLAAVNGVGGTTGLRVDIETTPKKPSADSSVQIRLTPRKTQTNAIDQDLEIQHEKKMHLIAVSSDLSWMAHLHPQEDREGHFDITTEFPYADPYVLYVDIKPKGQPGQVIPLRVVVEGKAKKPAPVIPSTSFEAKQGDLQISLQGADQLHASQSATLKMSLRKGGKPFAITEPYLGAQAHLIAVSEDRIDFVHGHAGEHGGHHTPAPKAKSGKGKATKAAKTPVVPLNFSVTFPRAGKYRIWLQFMDGKLLRTVPFTVTVT